MKSLTFEKVLLSFVILVCIVFFAFVTTIIFSNVSALNNQQSTAETQLEADISELTTYEYIITSIDESGIYGDSMIDDTGIYLTHENVEGMELNENDLIKVSFPADDWETITKVELVNKNK